MQTEIPVVHQIDSDWLGRFGSFGKRQVEIGSRLVLALFSRHSKKKEIGERSEWMDKNSQLKGEFTQN
jgi:hypothetical protein